MRKIKYELPVRFCFWYDEVRSYRYLDTAGFFNKFLLEATSSWKKAEMIKYVPESLKDKIYQSWMVLTTVSSSDDLGIFCHLVFEVDNSFGPDDSLVLMNWISGQMSDGWGEGFEQRPFDSFVYHTEEEDYDEDTGESYTVNGSAQGEISAEFWWDSSDCPDGRQWYVKEIF